MALHDHNEEDVADKLIAILNAGESVALVSDAGTPLVSDPGFRLLRAAHGANIVVSPLPGPSAVTAALSVAGLPCDRFCFEGFLPAKSKGRRDALQRLAAEQRTMIFYESVHRITDSLADFVAIFGADRPAFLGRELTKMHEQCVQGTLAEMHEKSVSGEVTSKGEFVVIVAGAPEASPSSLDIDRLLREFSAVLPGKDVAKVLSRATGEKRNVLYQRLLELTKGSG